MEWLTYAAIIILSIVIIVLIILLALGVFQPYPSPETPLVDELLNSISLQEGWNPVEGIPVEGERGQCLLYNTFSVETNVVDNIEPIGSVAELPSEFRCDDGFTEPLQKRSRVCAQAECLGSNGALYKQGETELYYVQCTDVGPCPNSRSAIVLNFNVYGGVVTPDARCITADGSLFGLAPCPHDTTGSGSHFFLNVDMVPVTDTSSIARIRSPGTDQCLLYTNDQTLTVGSCLSASDDGYVWFVSPEICPDSSKCYPQQITTIPPDIDEVDFEDPEALQQLASELKSLQINGPNLSLQPYALCSKTSGVECKQKTGIISAYSYASIF